ncbi:MAG: tryptophan synthase subunit alpha [Clostridiales bacterium]|nr:tryptophan synthase subunit alpha [Clostridiales bacterium]
MTIKEKFIELNEKGKKALITFTVAGDPDLKTTSELVKEMASKGADIIELGIPYSDPLAEGPVILRANSRALQNEINLTKVFPMCGELNKDLKTPLVFLLYFNVILQYGIGHFFRNCSHNGISGVIIPDLPFEEKDEIAPAAKDWGVDIISLVSPTSGDRIEKIAKEATGFLYCVSSTGVTGIRDTFNTNFHEFFRKINQATKIPKALGFGISSPEQVKELKKWCDGIIIGSSIVKIIEKSGSPEESITEVGKFIKTLRAALDS